MAFVDTQSNASQSFVGMFFDSLGRALAANQDIKAVSAMSDDQRAASGLTRETALRQVFEQHFDQ